MTIPLCSFLFLASAIFAIIISPVIAFGGWPPRCNRTHRRVSSSIPSKNKNKETWTDNNDAYDPRDNLGRALRGLQSVAFKKTMEPGDTVVCKREVPSLGIFENEGYELKSVYAQYFDQETQTVVKEPLVSLDAPVPVGCDRYVTLYSPVHHEEPVVVAPDEVGLASVRSEFGDAAWLAIPGFFWVFVIFNVYNIYHERTGGSFFDAFWGR